MVDVGLLTPGIGDNDPDDVALLRAMVRAEVAWAHAQEQVGTAPAGTGAAFDEAATAICGDDSAATVLAASIAADSAQTGNPVLGVVAALRASLPAAHHSTLHKDLTSQDILDTALVLIVADAAAATSDALTAAGTSLTALVRAHRSTATLGRTLGQAALPTTLGARMASWLQVLAESHTRLQREAADAPLAFGGAAGTLAGAASSHAAAGADPFAVATAWAQHLGLRVTPGPWHVTRFPVERLAGALAEVCAAGGKIAADVLAAARPEVGELREHAAPGKGASSAMPFKANPVLSITMRRCALAAPHALAQVATGAGLAVDERPDGAWHVEWAALRSLARDALICARSAASLFAGLTVDAEATARNLAAHLPGDYGVGHAEKIVDRVLDAYGYGA